MRWSLLGSVHELACAEQKSIEDVLTYEPTVVRFIPATAETKPLPGLRL